MRKSLLHPEDLEEIKERINKISENSVPKWGKMQSAQMFRHCDKILQIAVGKIILPKINPFIKCIGVLTKKEMYLLNNGIPPNMPTFAQVKVTEKCNFEKSRQELLSMIDEFIENSEKDTLVSEHALFGKMTAKDWGFLQYKHLNHHLKQFEV
ncbi:DUF1569 domain-containing protein [Chryseobacterium sp.]|uniref:DUF1569 domain-containing protein n=1 Tax=Chryseobacterium sp. TaxID=1871047 RepID=UPI0011CAC80E|nr:DUF1569 domain-containing protein [Chryseobacterium sp.]TXF79398.1 DUF1569 domain-containing protein [Chryseobacterium sp.]